MELVGSPRARDGALEWEKARARTAWQFRASAVVGGLLLVGLLAVICTENLKGTAPGSRSEFSLGFSATSQSSQGGAVRGAVQSIRGAAVQQLASMVLADANLSSASAMGGNASDLVCDCLSSSALTVGLPLLVSLRVRRFCADICCA